jgi:hypothetical protein
VEPEKIYQHLEELAERLGISVRYEDLSASGFRVKSGLCTIKGKATFLMDKSMNTDQRISLLSECLEGMELEGVFIVPALRSLLQGGSSE